MPYNFNEIIDRYNTNSEKYDFAAENGKPADILPMWVADMDFKAPPEVLAALQTTVEHGIFGYSETKDDYFATVANWYKTYFNWQVQPDWLIKTPGVVFAICATIRALTKPGDAVLIQQPVYYPFALSIEQNDRKLVNNNLVYQDGYYTIDFADFEQKIIDNKVKLFILCSPHNPVGRVWRKEELMRLGDIACRHKVYIIADEIHSDFVNEGYTHHVFAALKPDYLERTITCTAPSKTFNLAGLQVSNIFIANSEVRAKVATAIAATGYCELNTMGIVAAKAAYTHGRQWLDELKQYIASNAAFAEVFLANHLPKVKLIKPEGTYLLWLDFSDLGLTDQALNNIIVNSAKLWFDEGTMFGSAGTNFQRINIACPRATLATALQRLAKALND